MIMLSFKCQRMEANFDGSIFPLFQIVWKNKTNSSYCKFCQLSIHINIVFVRWLLCEIFAIAWAKVCFQILTEHQLGAHFVKLSLHILRSYFDIIILCMYTTNGLPIFCISGQISFLVSLTFVCLKILLKFYESLEYSKSEA